MSSTVDYRNANADWRFVIPDVRGPDGTPFDLTGFRVAVTFRPDADRATDIIDCSTDNARVTVTPGSPANPNASPPIAAMGPTVTIAAPAAGRVWRPSRPMLVVGDVMISQAAAGGPTEDPIKRLAFVALPGTT